MDLSEQGERVFFVSLGCPKNRVDSEIMLGALENASLQTAARAEDADVIVVNTCGFIEDAKKESIDVILEMAQHRLNGRARRLIVTGCLVQRYSKELADDIPEIDVLLGTGAYETVVAAALRDGGRSEVPRSHGGGREARVQVEPPGFLHEATTPRVNTFLPHSAYVKVSEGCDQKCSFCAIPSMRGRQRSRPVDDIVLEASTLAARGIVELNLIAQDLTGYGTDRSDGASLATLLRALGQVEGAEWIRLHYAYPRPFSKALLSALAEEPKVLPYIDMPLQHIADPVLRRMQRGRPRRFIEKLLADIRRAVPGVVLRTSFIVGFPGETQEDFDELIEFVASEDFDRVGVFRFSQEEGTPSFDLPNQLDRETIEGRHQALMTLLQTKSRAKMATYVGRRLEVLVDGVAEESELLLAGRHAGQAPEIDGTTYINDGSARAGDIVELEVTESFDYDLVGRVVRVLKPAPWRPSHPRLQAGAQGQARAQGQAGAQGRASVQEAAGGSSRQPPIEQGSFRDLGGELEEGADLSPKLRDLRTFQRASEGSTVRQHPDLDGSPEAPSRQPTSASASASVAARSQGAGGRRPRPSLPIVQG